MMPGRNGLWLVGEVRRDHPGTAVVLATGHAEKVDQAGDFVADFLIKPFKRERFVLAVDRGRKWRRQAAEEADWHVRLVRDFEVGLARIVALLRDRASAVSEEMHLRRLGAERAPDVMLHGERVAGYAGLLARELGVDAPMAVVVERAARFHDIGKVAVPAPLLSKPSPMTAGELVVMQRHVEAGAHILEATETLRDAAPIVRASHEWFGGGGYPSAMAGDAIPLASRIIAIADAYDAMTETRSYRAQLDRKEAVAELLRCSPSQFDPDLVVAFLSMLGRR
jgi:putative nucleotidyltransferase with HDIG domain